MLWKWNKGHDAEPLDSKILRPYKTGSISWICLTKNPTLPPAMLFPYVTSLSSYASASHNSSISRCRVSRYFWLFFIFPFHYTGIPFPYVFYLAHLSNLLTADSALQSFPRWHVDGSFQQPAKGKKLGNPSSENWLNTPLLSQTPLCIRMHLSYAAGHVWLLNYTRTGRQREAK